MRRGRPHTIPSVTVLDAADEGAAREVQLSVEQVERGLVNIQVLDPVDDTARTYVVAATIDVRLIDLLDAVAHVRRLSHRPRRNLRRTR